MSKVQGQHAITRCLAPSLLGDPLVGGPVDPGSERTLVLPLITFPSLVPLCPSPPLPLSFIR